VFLRIPEDGDRLVETILHVAGHRTVPQLEVCRSFVGIANAERFLAAFLPFLVPDLGLVVDFHGDLQRGTRRLRQGMRGKPVQEGGGDHG
jgi:hypothetical protein